MSVGNTYLDTFDCQSIMLILVRSTVSR